MHPTFEPGIPQVKPYLHPKSGKLLIYISGEHRDPHPNSIEAA